MITACAVAQLAILYGQSPWLEGLLTGLALAAVLAAFAFTRLKWDSHLDMFLVMIAPGGLGMLVAGMLTPGDASCHMDSGSAWTGFLWMSLGMAVASMPLCWWKARCLLEARAERRGASALLLDWAGMEIGMALGMAPALLLPMHDARTAWLHHGLMLAGMALGMLAAALEQAALLQRRRPVGAAR